MRIQRRPALPAALVLGVLLCSSAAGQTTAAGWRGDGGGKYPAARAPLRWNRTSTAVDGLRFMAAKPRPGDVGAPMPDGVIRQWLVLGPVRFPPDAQIEKDTVPGETELAPDERDNTAGLTWKKASLETAYLDFAKLVGKPGDAVAFACPLVVMGNGAVLRASDGKVLYTDPQMGNQAIASPVVEQGRVFQMPSWNNELVAYDLPAQIADPLRLSPRRIPLDLLKFPKHYLPWHIASPVVPPRAGLPAQQRRLADGRRRGGGQGCLSEDARPGPATGPQ